MKGEGEAWEGVMSALVQAEEAFIDGDVWKGCNYLNIAAEYGEILKRQEAVKEESVELKYDSK